MGCTSGYGSFTLKQHKEPSRSPALHIKVFRHIIHYHSLHTIPNIQHQRDGGCALCMLPSSCIWDTLTNLLDWFNQFNLHYINFIKKKNKKTTKPTRSKTTQPPKQTQIIPLKRGVRFFSLKRRCSSHLFQQEYSPILSNIYEQLIISFQQISLLSATIVIKKVDNLTAIYLDFFKTKHCSSVTSSIVGCSTTSQAFSLPSSAPSTSEKIAK